MQQGREKQAICRVRKKGMKRNKYRIRKGKLHRDYSIGCVNNISI